MERLKLVLLISAFTTYSTTLQALHLHGPKTKLASPANSLTDSKFLPPHYELTRRNVISKTLTLGSVSALPRQVGAKNVDVTGGGRLFEINDPQTYSAIVYTPKYTDSQQGKEKYPVLFILHGAGKNEKDVWNLANVKGEHSGLAPSLLQEGKAPVELYDNFIVITPYSKGKKSFYEEPRSKLLQFMSWSIRCDGGGAQGIDCDRIDREKTYLFGFSDGATLGIELMTTGKFGAGIFAAYGFTGTLPQLALERLKGTPLWIFHSKDDGKHLERCTLLIVILCLPTSSIVVFNTLISHLSSAM